MSSHSAKGPSLSFPKSIWENARREAARGALINIRTASFDAATKAQVAPRGRRRPRARGGLS